MFIKFPKSGNKKNEPDMEMPSSISTRLRYQHKVLLDLIEGLSDEDIRKKPDDNKWSIFEHMVHLQSYQHVFMERMRVIMEKQNPSFERYRADNDPEFHGFVARSSREVMQDLLATRKQLNADVTGLLPQQMSRTGTHPMYGKMNVMKWLNFFLLHEAHHLYAIFKLTGSIQQPRY